MNKIGKTEDALVLRTDFSNEEKWQEICKAIETPEPIENFKANVTFLSDAQYQDISTEKVISLIDPEDHWFAFIVDEVTINSPDHPVLALDFLEDPGNSFRVIPSEIWGVENNLSMSNMGFSEFTENLESDGIFRGFE
jgi:hypothetical protein